MSEQLEFYTSDADGNKVFLVDKDIYVEFSDDELAWISINEVRPKHRLNILIHSTLPNTCGGHMLMRAFGSNVLTIYIEKKLLNPTDVATPRHFYTKDSNDFGNGVKTICNFNKLYVKYSERESLSIEIVHYDDRPAELVLRSFNGPEFGGDSEGAKGTCIVTTLHAANVISIDVVTPTET